MIESGDAPVCPKADLPVNHSDVESWRSSWRKYIVHKFTRERLVELWSMLLTDDPRIIRHQTTEPSDFIVYHDHPCFGGCPGAWAYIGQGATVGYVNEKFEHMLAEFRDRSGLGLAPFLWWWDSIHNHRSQVLAELAAEIDYNLGRGPDPVGKQKPLPVKLRPYRIPLLPVAPF